MKKNIILSIFACAMIIIPGLMLTGCQNSTGSSSEIAPDPFTSKWSFDKENRTFSISGNSAGHIAGKQSEFQMRMENLNSADTWRGEYCILLIDQKGIVKEISREQYDVPAGQETQKQFLVDFPENFSGPLGLCVVFPQRSSMVTTVWIGKKSMKEAGHWPDIETCPACLTEACGIKLAEDFVRNSPTFKFDGIEESLELVNSITSDTENAWQFVFHFESRHAGYGDRTGIMLAQVITPHKAVIAVEDTKIKSAVMDERWNILTQSMINER